MTRRRFYAPPHAFSADRQSVTLSDDEAHHLREVVRLRAGDEAYVFDGAGREFHCTVEDHSTDLRVVAEVDPARPESSLNLTLAIALLKGEKFDLVIQKATELGTAHIVPIESEHADIRTKDEKDRQRRLTRWRRIALEAAKQSGRARVPEISAPQKLPSLLMMPATEAQENSALALHLMFSERNGGSLAKAVESLMDQPRRVIALVGPEGGWSDDEIESARAARWEIITLGGRTLRAETAAIAVVTILQHRFGDLV